MADCPKADFLSISSLEDDGSDFFDIPLPALKRNIEHDTES